MSIVRDASATRASQNVRAFECGYKGWPHTTVIYALTAGKAKYEYLLHLRDAWGDADFSRLTCRRVGSFQPLALRRTAATRGLPFVQAGSAIEVEGKRGVVVASNDSGNFDVLFTEGKAKGQTLNCHPRWKTRYFAADGSVLADFTAPQTAPSNSRTGSAQKKSDQEQTNSEGCASRG